MGQKTTRFFLNYSGFHFGRWERKNVSCVLLTVFESDWKSNSWTKHFFWTPKNVPKMTFLAFPTHDLVFILHLFFKKTFPMSFRFQLFVVIFLQVNSSWGRFLTLFINEVLWKRNEVNNVSSGLMKKYFTFFLVIQFFPLLLQNQLELKIKIY